jgi:uncharacterized protein (TIGR02301 family)
MGPFLVALLVTAFTAVLPASAQQPQQPGRGARPPATRSTPAPGPAKPAEPPPAPEAPPPAYEKEVLRLSEIVGSLAFLRALCASSDAAEWPKRMQALLESEGTTPARRERLAGAYNRGYRGYALTYRTCTPSATEATARYIKEGETLSRNLAGRFGG